ncbi:MAG: hypothetical protein JWP44_4197 [Mucilaginibacter sp.]|jgi:hypothetical protein|nr:hypothetical protein [Mucilaginibacter sp.]
MAGGSIFSKISSWQRIFRRSGYEGDDGVRIVMPGSDDINAEETDAEAMLNMRGRNRVLESRLGRKGLQSESTAAHLRREIQLILKDRADMSSKLRAQAG